jgi:hypothetical protein
MSIEGIIKRLIVGRPLTAAEHDTNLTLVEDAVAGKADVVHSHVAADITDFTEAVEAVSPPVSWDTISGKPSTFPPTLPIGVADVTDAVATGDSRLTNAREWTAATVSQGEAEAGTATDRRAWTAQRVRQAIAAWWATVSGTKADTSHVHGNITSDGKVGTEATRLIGTLSQGVVAPVNVSSSLLPDAPSEDGHAFFLGVVFGTGENTACEGNDSRLSDARTPTAHASSHQTGGADAIPNVVVSPAEITSNQNNYSPGTGDIVRLTSDAARDITGLVAGTSGQVRLLVNVGSHAITLKHANGSSDAANRFVVPWAGDCVLPASGGSAMIVYDATTERWRVA